MMNEKIDRNRQVVFLHSKGITQREIARNFGITQGRVWQIVKAHELKTSRRVRK